MKTKIVAYSKHIIGLIKKGGELMIEAKVKLINLFLSLLPKVSDEQKFILLRDILIGFGVTGILLSIDLSRMAAHH